MTPLEYLLCFFLVFLSGFLASSEVSLFSLSRFQLRYLRDHFRPSYRRIKKLLADPPGLLVTILVLNEVVNVSLATIITNAISRDWGEKGPAWVQSIPGRFHAMPGWALQTLTGLLVTTPVILLLCEGTPKVTAARLNQLIAPLAAGPLLWIYRLFRPARTAIMVAVRLLTGRLSARAAPGAPQQKTLLREEEFLSLVEEGHREGTIHEIELDLVRNVFDLDDTEAIEVCTPIAKVFTLPAHMKLAEASRVVIGNPHARIPVIGESKKDVAGILYFKDLIQVHLSPEIADHPISSVMHEPYFVPAKMKLNTLFRRLKNLKIHLAVVQNDAEEAVGVITMGDILTEVFEDLFPESEPGQASQKPAAGAPK